MTQVTQKNNDVYDPSKLEPYLKLNPDTKNSILYSLCGAITDTEKGYIRKKKSRILEGFNGDESSNNAIDSKKSKVYTKKKVKESFQEDNNLDPELTEMTDSELIRHTCRNIISTKNSDSKIKLQASNLLLSFIDKSGIIKDLIPDAHQELQKKFRSMPISEVAKRISDRYTKQEREDAMGYMVSREGIERELEEGNFE